VRCCFQQQYISSRFAAAEYQQTPLRCQRVQVVQLRGDGLGGCGDGCWVGDVQLDAEECCHAALGESGEASCRFLCLRKIPQSQDSIITFAASGEDFRGFITKDCIGPCRSLVSRR